MASGAAGVRAAVSPRTLHRRFRSATGASPSAWLTEGLGRARELLEGAALPLEEIATACTFGTAASMRHHSHMSLGTSPAAYRARFAANA